MIPLIATLMIMGCASTSNVDSESFPIRFQHLDSPAGNRSAEPNISKGGDGTLYLSWIEELSDSLHGLSYSSRSDGSWSAPIPIAKGDNWFVNWADFPATAANDENTILASWLERTGDKTYAYGVRLSISNDNGGKWNSPFFVHSDSTLTEHGFVSLVSTPTNQFVAIWLDGRETVHEDGPMSLRTATITETGAISDEFLLDPRVCDCCQTSATFAGDSSIVVVYRDRSEDETRDISVVRFEDGVWSEPKSVHEDGWQIAGCPVNGPAVAAKDSLVAVAWFTVGSKDVPAVNVAFSRDYGRSFDLPKRVDSGNPEGRVDIVFCDSSSVIVSWIENGSENAHLMVRRLSADGRMSKPMQIAMISSDRESGFPHLGFANGEVLLAWTDTAEDSKVRTALIETN